MSSKLRTSLVLGLLGGIVATSSLVLLYAVRPGLVIDMASEPHALLSGVYPPERDDSGLTSAWTRDRRSVTTPA